jgi:hypothetical protein
MPRLHGSFQIRKVSLPHPFRPADIQPPRTGASNRHRRLIVADARGHRNPELIERLTADSRIGPKKLREAR